MFPLVSGSLVEEEGGSAVDDCVVADGVGGGREHPSRLPAAPFDVADWSHGSVKSLCPREVKTSALLAAFSTISTSKHVE